MGDSRRRYQRLRDCIKPGVLVLFVGINPGLRSAQTGHHFAGHSNRFWKLLHESKLVSEPLTYREDRRLPEWRLGLTNIIGRCTAGIDVLDPVEYRQGVASLKRKIRRYQPHIVALLGVTIFQTLFSPKGRSKAHLILDRPLCNSLERRYSSCRIRVAAMHTTHIARCSLSFRSSVTTWSGLARSTAPPP